MYSQQRKEDVETSVQIMQAQRTTDRMDDHITWLAERVPVNEEAYVSSKGLSVSIRPH